MESTVCFTAGQSETECFLSTVMARTVRETSQRFSATSCTLTSLERSVLISLLPPWTNPPKRTLQQLHTQKLRARKPLIAPRRHQNPSFNMLARWKQVIGKSDEMPWTVHTEVLHHHNVLPLSSTFLSTPDHVFSEGQVSDFEDAGYTRKFLLDEGIIILSWCLALAVFMAVGEGWATAAIVMCWVVAHNAFAVGEVARGVVACVLTVDGSSLLLILVAGHESSKPKDNGQRKDMTSRDKCKPYLGRTSRHSNCRCGNKQHGSREEHERSVDRHLHFVKPEDLEHRWYE